VWHSVWKYFGCTLHLLFHLDISVPWILITGQPWSLTWSQTMICQFQTTMHEQIRHIVVERMCTLICINFPSIWSFVWKRRCFHRFGVLYGNEGVFIDLEFCMEKKGRFNFHRKAVCTYKIFIDLEFCSVIFI
jgi:hypothetical protein